MGGASFTQGRALGYVLLPLRGDSPRGGLNILYLHLVLLKITTCKTFYLNKITLEKVSLPCAMRLFFYPSTLFHTFFCLTFYLIFCLYFCLIIWLIIWLLFCLLFCFRFCLISRLLSYILSILLSTISYYILTLHIIFEFTSSVLINRVLVKSQAKPHRPNRQWGFWNIIKRKGYIGPPGPPPGPPIGPPSRRPPMGGMGPRGPSDCLAFWLPMFLNL